MASSDEPTSGELVKGAVEVVKTAYGDAVQPMAHEVGKALGTVGRTVNVALSPLRGLVWGWEQIEQFVKAKVEAKLNERKVPTDRIVTPDPDVAVPALEAMRYSKLRENYAGLIATAMDK
jgi:Abortive infection alpha